MKFWENYKKKLKGELTGDDYKKLSKPNKRAYLVKKINDHKQTMWIGIILCFTIVGAIIGLPMAFIGHELKSKKEQELAKLG